MWCYFIPIDVNRLLFLHSVILSHWKGCNTCFKIIVLTWEVHALGLSRMTEQQKDQNLLPKKPTAHTPLPYNRDKNHAQRLWRSSPVVYTAGLVHRDRWIHNFKADKNSQVLSHRQGQRTVACLLLGLFSEGHLAWATGSPAAHFNKIIFWS